MSIQIGDIKLESNIILAPLSGVTDLPFRKLVKKFGAGLVVSEMVASMAMIRETRQSLQKCAINLNDATAACVQLAGCEPNVIALAAKMNVDMGAKIIDLNFGCPAKKVVGGYSGSALMRDEVLAGKIFEKAVESVNVPVTLKMRVGWDDENKNAPKLAEIAENSGIKMITIHGRTRNQFYSGKADWKFIKNVKDRVKVPVIANGDIVCFESATQALQDSRADGIMVGRGTYGKPWFLSQLAHYFKTGVKLSDPTMSSQLDIVLEHYDMMLEHYEGDTGVKLARKHLGWYSSGIPNSSEFRALINRLTDHKEVKSLIIEFYSKFI